MTCSHKETSGFCSDCTTDKLMSTAAERFELLEWAGKRPAVLRLLKVMREVEKATDPPDPPARAPETIPLFWR